MSPGQTKTIKREVKPHGEAFDGGPLDPEQGQAAVGVGIMSVDGLQLNPITNPARATKTRLQPAGVPCTRWA